MKNFILFYKDISQVGGAEILLAEHYLWLKKHNKNVKLICFNFSNLDRVNIDKKDIIHIEGNHWMIKFFNFLSHLKRINIDHIFCHSGYIETYLASLFVDIKYSIFYHHPTSMTVNEIDKFSIYFWRRFKKFNSGNFMFKTLKSKFDSFTLRDHIYINLRAIFSYLGLKFAKNIFVLTKKAKIELKNIFNLNSIVLAGAIKKDDLKNMMVKRSKNILKSKLNLLTISRHDPNKRIEIIIKSIPYLIKQGIKPNLIIGGTGEITENLKLLVNSLKINKYISFKGYIKDSEISKYYYNSDIFISIDWGDYRLTTFEALIFKLRVIVSDDTSYTDLFNSGYLFSSKPLESELAKTIIKCLETRNFWSHQKLYTHLSEYTWENYFSNIYQYVIR